LTLRASPFLGAPSAAKTRSRPGARNNWNARWSASSWRAKS
jgi:hypothetical protein